MTGAAGIDIGSSGVKTAIFRVETGGGEKPVETLLASRVDRLLRRNPAAVAEEGYQAALATAGLSAEEVDYVASTGEGEIIEFRRGHFYTMTTHARGAKYLLPDA